VIAPIHTGLVIALLLACLLPAAALARGQALAVGFSTIYPHISVSEKGNLCVRRVADSGLAVGSIFGFTYYDQNRDRLTGRVIDRITSEPGSSEDILARLCCATVKGARPGVVCGFDDFLEETISAQAVGPKSSLVGRGLAPPGSTRAEANCCRAGGVSQGSSAGAAERYPLIQ